MLAVIVTTPSEQSAFPLQPANVEPDAGVAVRVTCVLMLYSSEQSEPQLMPLADTVPLPVPDLLIDRVY